MTTTLKYNPQVFISSHIYTQKPPHHPQHPPHTPAFTFPHSPNSVNGSEASPLHPSPPLPQRLRPEHLERVTEPVSPFNIQRLGTQRHPVT